METAQLVPPEILASIAQVRAAAEAASPAAHSALAHLNLGDCYRLLGKYNEAKSEFDKALSIDSSLAAVHYDLGLMYLTAPNMPGTSADQQVSTAIKELNQYKTMRGPKPPPGVQDDIDSLLDRAKANRRLWRPVGRISAPRDRSTPSQW